MRTSLNDSENFRLVHRGYLDIWISGYGESQLKLDRGLVGVGGSHGESLGLTWTRMAPEKGKGKAPNLKIVPRSH